MFAASRNSASLLRSASLRALESTNWWSISCQGSVILPLPSNLYLTKVDGITVLCAGSACVPVACYSCSVVSINFTGNHRISGGLR